VRVVVSEEDEEQEWDENSLGQAKLSMGKWEEGGTRRKGS